MFTPLFLFDNANLFLHYLNNVNFFFNILLNSFWLAEFFFFIIFIIFFIVLKNFNNNTLLGLYNLTTNSTVTYNSPNTFTYTRNFKKFINLIKLNSFLK